MELLEIKADLGGIVERREEEGRVQVTAGVGAKKTTEGQWDAALLNRQCVLVPYLIETETEDRYTCRTPHVHMYSHSTHRTAQMTCVLGSRGFTSLRRMVCQNIHASTRHVSSCASQHTEHLHKFSLTCISCVTHVCLSDSRLVVYASIHPLERSAEGWHFHGTPTSHRN